MHYLTHNGPSEASRSTDARVGVTFIPTRVCHWVGPTLLTGSFQFLAETVGGEERWVMRGI